MVLEAAGLDIKRSPPLEIKKKGGEGFFAGSLKEKS